ncbi:MAG: dihydroorotate dehydrogenase [Pseudomonadota bacterium]
MAEAEHKAETDGGLEAFFEASRQEQPPLSPALMARVQADAERELERSAVRPSQEAAPARGFNNLLASLSDALGGWAGAGGLVAATLVGAWIGVAAPDTVGTYSGLIGTSEGDPSEWLSYPDVGFDLGGV